jgi:hypothetical protein
MQDISTQLAEVIRDRQCSALLAFIVVENGLHIQESESDKESCGRLRDTRDIDTDR